MQKNQKLASIISLLRRDVRALLDEDNTPSDISFALAYVATELGLNTAKNQAMAYPVVLSAMSQAARNKNKQIEKQSLDAIGDMSASSLVH